MNVPAAGPIIRKTHGLCPECLLCVPAEVREEKNAIFLVRTCREHGESRTFLSAHPDYYRDLNRYYFSVMRKSHPQRDFIVRMTERCNLDCPICLAGANQDVLADFTLDEFRRLVRRFKGVKLDLMGCEPTEMESLPDILREGKKSGNVNALHSNGIALADFGYAQRLKKTGLDEVHLQFDGFDDEAYRIIRGRPLLDLKLKACDNLAKLDIAVDLVMVLLAGVNEKEIAPVIDFGIARPNVKEVFFLGCRMLGRAAQGFDDVQLLPDQVIDMVAKATGDRVSRERVRRFQKLYFALLSIFGVRKCFYIQHYLILRNRDGGYETIDDVIDMKGLEPHLEKFRERRERGDWKAAPGLALRAISFFLNRKALGLMMEFLALSLMMVFGFNLRRVRRRAVMLGYITACDPLIYDTDIAENCGKGEISRDLGVQETGATANVLREHRWRNQPCASSHPS
jgi:pyruvate-formate lyase-activating enzyme